MRRGRRSHQGIGRAVQALLLASTLAACLATPVPSGGPSATPGGSPTASPPHLADTIRIGLVSPDIGPAPAAYPLSNLIRHYFAPESELPGKFLFNALYRFDASLTPVPDLAAKPCDFSADLRTFTCTLRRAQFSNGDAVTAEDIKFTYDLARSPVCPFDPGVGCGDNGDKGLAGLVADVQVVDPTTVRITLTAPSSLFYTLILPNLWIDSKQVVQAQFAAFRAKASAVGAARLQQSDDALEAALGGTSPDCAKIRTEYEPLAQVAGIALPDPAIYDVAPDGSFDACQYDSDQLDVGLSLAAQSLQASGIDAIALAYPLMSLNTAPIGTGAWSVDAASSSPGKRLILRTSPSHAANPPATRTIDFEIFPTRDAAATALAAGRLDWLPLPTTGDLGAVAARYERVRTFPGVTFAAFPNPGNVETLEYNIDTGSIFSEKNVRLALAECIDKPSIVYAATDGQGVPAYGSIPPDVWASNPDLPQPPQNIDDARRLIAASGWQVGADGTYIKGKQRLAGDLWVNQLRPDRVRFVRVLADQARACGFDLRAKPALKFLGAVECVPHIGPGTTVPAAAWFAGTVGPFDPDATETQWDSAFISTANQCNANLDGYHNADVDTLVRQARTTYSIADRAKDYRQEQAILASDPPNLFAWIPIQRVALRSGMSSTDGPLDLTAPGWDWQLERLILIE